MNIRLNLATTPLESNRRFAVFASLVGGLGLIAMVLLSWHAYTVRRANTAYRIEQQSLEADMQRLQAQRAQLEAFFNRPETVQRRELSTFLNGLIAQRAFPWTQIFMDLERNLPEGVRVVSIEPRLAADHLELRLTIGALDDAGKLRFLKALEESHQFSEIEVLGEARNSRAGDTDQVVLSLVAHYSAS